MFRQRLLMCTAALCFAYTTSGLAQGGDEPTEAESAPAAATAPAAEKTEALSKAMPEFKFQYRFGMSYFDDGFKKDAKADEPYTSLGLDAFRILMDGKVGSNLSYSLRLKLEGSDPKNLDYGYLKWKLSDSHSISFGKIKVRDYGWEHRSYGSALSLVQSYGHAIRPYKYEDLVAFEGKYNWGAVTLQAAKDVAPACATLATPTCKSWTKLNANKEAVQNQPALFFEYVGDFAGVKPLLQYGAYDQNHSSLATLGVKYEANALNVEVDYTLHNIGAKGKKAGGTKEENLVSKESNIALNASYKVSEWKPFVHFSVYDMEQYTDSGVKQPKVNSAVGKFDDNATTMGLGAEYFMYGDAVRPYLAWVQKSGKFNDKNNKEATMAENEIKLGIKGEF